MAFAGFYVPDDNDLKDLLKKYIDQGLSMARGVNSQMNNVGFQIEVESKVHKWGQTFVPPKWHDPRQGWIHELELPCTFEDQLDVIANSIERCHVFCLQSSTGSGKSTMSPAFVFEGIRRAMANNRVGSSFNSQFGFKCLHLVPSGEQARQNHKFVSAEYRRLANIKTGDYSSALSSRGRRMNLCLAGETNYLYATYFFADHGLHQRNKIHAVVIDEVHDLTPEVISLLSFVKKKLAREDCLRIILLSATMSEELEDKLRGYFSEPPLIFLNQTLADNSRFGTNVVLANGDGYSSNAMESPVDSVLRANEMSGSRPDLVCLRNRALAILVQRLSRYTDSGSIPSSQIDRGYLVFLPGSEDVVLAKADFNISLSRGPLQPIAHQVAVYHVSGLERSDLCFVTDLDYDDMEVDLEDGPISRLQLLEEINKRKEENKGKMLVVFSTPLLTSGVTLHRITTIIDTGTVKIPSPHNRQGIYSLDAVWEDKVAREQRKGRVGRTEPGDVYHAFSRTTNDVITNTDNANKHLQSKFNTADLVSLLNEMDVLLYEPDHAVKEVLMTEAGITGFFRTDQFPPPTAGYPFFFHPLKIDEVGVAIRRCLKGVPLDLGNFLIYCRVFNCLMPGLVLTTAILSRHCGLKRPSRDGPGRDCPNFHLNEWCGLSGCQDDGDLVVYTDLLMNLMAINLPDIRLSTMSPYLPEHCLHWIGKEGTEEVQTIYYSLAAGLRALGLIPSTEPIKWISHVANSGVFKTTIRDEVANKDRKYLHMADSTLHRFKVCIHAALGSRVLHRCPYGMTKQRTSHTMYYVPGYPSVDKPRLVQGERMRQRSSDLVAIYYNIYIHSPGDAFLTAFLQQSSGAEMLLYGNVSGASHDVVRDDALHIHLNTGSMIFKFEDSDLLDYVFKWRKMLRLLPAARLMGRTNLINLVKEAVDQMNHPPSDLQEIRDVHILSDAVVITDPSVFL